MMMIISNTVGVIITMMVSLTRLKSKNVPFRANRAAYIGRIDELCERREEGREKERRGKRVHLVEECEYNSC